MFLYAEMLFGQLFFRFESLAIVLDRETNETINAADRPAGIWGTTVVATADEELTDHKNPRHDQQNQNQNDDNNDIAATHGFLPETRMLALTQCKPIAFRATDSATI